MVENDNTKALEWYDENAYKLYDSTEINKLNAYDIIDKALDTIDANYLTDYEKAVAYYHSYEDMCYIDELIDDALIDYDSCDNMLSDIIVKEFISGLNINEKYILSCLLNGMTHQEISDTMDCTRQNVTRTVERLGTKAIDFLSYN